MPNDHGAEPSRTSELLTVEDAATMLACTPAAIRKWIHQRRLPSVKVGRLTRLRRRDVDAVVAHGLSARQPAGR
jgi:excisionase family DNA binding protein